MSPTVRDKWPLYIVTHDLISTQQMQLDKLVLVTSSFAFASLVRGCLDPGRSWRRTFDVVRVTHYNQFLPVGQQSSEFMAVLDQHWNRPPAVLAEAYCQLCVEIHRPDRHKEPKWIVNGVTALAKLAAPCAKHTNNASQGSMVDPTHCSMLHMELHGMDTGSSHYQLGLNAFNKHWPAANSAVARAALHSAKLAWIGPLYFARALRDRLPYEILEHIVDFAGDSTRQRP